MDRRQRQFDQLGALCRAGQVARAVDLAFEHFASFGRDERVISLLTQALDRHSVGAAIRRRLGDLGSAEAASGPRSAPEGAT